MRRFFSRNKEGNSNNNKAKSAGAVSSTTAVAAVDDALHTRETLLKSSHAPTGPSCSVPSSPAVSTATNAKQVAFASPKKEQSNDNSDIDSEDVYSAASHHGAFPSLNTTGPGLSCFTGLGIHGINAHNDHHQQHLTAPKPSQPIRHVSLDASSPLRDRDATLRASQTPVSPAPGPSRGEIPRFATPQPQSTSTSHNIAQQQRSTTSLSHNTTASTTSSLLEARQAFYGSNNASTSAYYPNLAVLATYSRDMNANAAAANHGQHSIMQHLTWSEITDEQLVENLGGRERTRQEVLFEMVCSEERYVQELKALKENYLLPLLERYTLSSSATFPTQDAFASSPNINMSSNTSPNLDSTLHPSGSGTVRSIASMDARRPFLSLSAGSGAHLHPSSSVSRYATPVPTSPSARRNVYSRASQYAADARAASVSVEHLPIAARFARRVSIDSPPMLARDLPSDTSNGDVAANESSHTTRTAVDHGHNAKNGRRDISGDSGGTGSTAVDSGDDTDTSHSKAHHHARFASGEGVGSGVIGSMGKTKSSRLHPLFSRSSTSKDKENQDPNIDQLEQTHTNSHKSSFNIPHSFRHHLKNLVPPPPNKLHKTSSPDLKDPNNIHNSAMAKGAGQGSGWVVKDLPVELKIVCEVVMKQILDGHNTLSERLRARYEEQFPLVRTLADVFNDQAWMVDHYATYVLHLESALNDIEETLSLMNPLLASNKKVKSKDKESHKEQKTLAKIIMHLEEEAALKGSPGLAICLSQPFQRLLKYPLLFQSLLYHTDPSTRDYDATQKLAFEIDAIVRSIESEKASEEDRAATRDIWARIEGINDRALLTPKADRQLVSEEAMWSSNSPSGNSAIAAARRTFSDASRRIEDIQENINATSEFKKKTTRRLSDIAGLRGAIPSHASDKKTKKPSIGSKRDVWLVSFTDVVIRCQRVAVTKLPMRTSAGPSANTRLNSIDTTRRAVFLSHKERNLYKFLKIDHWVMEDKTSPLRAGIVSMDAMARSRRNSGIIDSENEDNDEPVDMDASAVIQPVKFEREDDHAKVKDDQQSRMSFIYTGDEARPAYVFDVDPLVGLIKAEPPSSPRRISGKVPPRVSLPGTSPAASMEEAMRKRATAAAKFQNRLRPSLGEATNLPSAAARRVGTPPAGGPRQPRSASATQERGGFNKPTAASLAKASPSTSGFLTAGGGKGTRQTGGSGRNTPTSPKRVRAASSHADHPSNARSPPASSISPGQPHSPEQTPKAASRVRRNSLPTAQQNGMIRQLRTKHSSERLGRHGKGSDVDSGVALYNQFWQEDKQ